MVKSVTDSVPALWSGHMVIARAIAPTGIAMKMQVLQVNNFTGPFLIISAHQTSRNLNAKPVDIVLANPDKEMNWYYLSKIPEDIGLTYLFEFGKNLVNSL